MIVDGHLHVYRSKQEGLRAKDDYEVWEYGSGASVIFADSAGDVEDAMAALARGSAAMAIVTNMLPPIVDAADRGAELVAFNEWLCGVATKQPSFVPLYGVDPSVLPIPAQLPYLRSWATQTQWAGVKLHPPAHGYRVTDEALWPLFAACQELGHPILCHSGPSRDRVPRAEPESFRPVLAAFPQLKLIVAHLGGAAWRQTPKLAADFPGVHFDCSEIIHWLGARNAPTQAEFVQLVRAVGADRVLMGSDFPWYDVSRTIELVRSLPLLSDHEKAQILGGNAQRIFGFGDFADAAAAS